MGANVVSRRSQETVRGICCQVRKCLHVFGILPFALASILHEKLRHWLSQAKAGQWHSLRDFAVCCETVCTFCLQVSLPVYILTYTEQKRFLVHHLLRTLNSTHRFLFCLHANVKYIYYYTNYYTSNRYLFSLCRLARLLCLLSVCEILTHTRSKARTHIHKNKQTNNESCCSQ